MWRRRSPIWLCLMALGIGILIGLIIPSFVMGIIGVILIAVGICVIKLGGC